MEKVIITEQDILNANASIPLTRKWALAKYIAEWSLEKNSMSVVEKGKETIPLPDLYQRRTILETQFKIGVFVREYMGREFEPVHESGTDLPVTYLMAADEADQWSNFEAQLDRLKRSKDKAVADKCYDILNDYHAFVRMVSIEIEQELQVKNDLLGRMAWYLASTVSTVASEEIKAALEKLPQQEPEKSIEAQDGEDHIAEDGKMVEERVADESKTIEE